MGVGWVSQGWVINGQAIGRFAGSGMLPGIFISGNTLKTGYEEIDLNGDRLK